MDTEDNQSALAEETPGQVDGQTESLGDDSNGAVERGQGDGGDGETPSKKANPSPEKSTDDDDESDLIEALASGKMDSIDDDGKIKKPEAEKPKEEVAETPVEKTDEPDQDKPKEEPKALSDEDQQEISKAPKAYRKELKKIFEERHELRNQVQQTKAQFEELAPVKQFTDALIKHAVDAGLVISGEDGKIDASNLRDLIEQERQLHGKTPKEIAAYYRNIANDLDPDSVPVTIPQDLRDLVEVGTLKEEEALVLARKRDAELKKPETDLRRQREEANRKEQQLRETQAKVLHKAKQDGLSEIHQVATKYHARFGVEWDSIQKQVEAKLDPLMAETNPKGWARLAETVIESVIASRKVPVRKPTTTPAPASKPSKVGSDVSSEEDDIAALASGKGLT